MATIKLEHINKNFGDLHVLKDVNLEVKDGEKLVIIGPSGSGKSTTVRCMNFLETPTSGRILIDGEEMTEKNQRKIVREKISMVFQQFNLYPHLTVLRNLTLAPTKLHGSSDSAIRPVFIRRPCPVDSSSVLRSRGRSAARPRSSCSMSRPVHWIRKRFRTYSTSW